MIQELEAGDKCAKKLVLVEDNLSLCETKNMQLDSLLKIADAKELLYKNNESNYESIINAKDMQITNLNSDLKKARKSKRVVTIGGIAAIILTFIL